MTMMIHTAVRAPIVPRIRIKFGFLAKLAQNLVEAHRHSREAQNPLRAHGAILKDVGLSRLKVNGNTFLFSHRN